MFTRWIFAIFLLIFYSINLSESIISNETIDKDIIELSRLNDVLKYNFPWLFFHTQADICFMLSNCCPRVKQNLADYINLGLININSLISPCMNDQQANTNYEMCSSFETHSTILQYKDMKIFDDALQQNRIDIDIPTICSADEAYAVFCDWIDQEKIQSCERKRFTYVAQHKNENEYQTFVEQSKQQIQFILNTMNRLSRNEDPTLNILSNSATMIWKIDLILLILSIFVFTKNLLK